MATRQQAREAVVSLLYAYEIGNPNIDKFADEIYEERKVRNKQREFAHALYDGVIENLEMVDQRITAQLKEWSFDKLGAMERAILRLGTYEVLFLETDRAVVINEAVELSKKFGTEQTPRFINGVLDAIKKEQSDAPKFESPNGESGESKSQEAES